MTLRCRQGCELPCDTQLDCNALCECWGSCGADSYCTCSACEALAPDAASDSQFFTIQNAAATSGAASASVIAGGLLRSGYLEAVQYSCVMLHRSTHCLSCKEYLLAPTCLALSHWVSCIA